jgi:asparagine synthase (glutamine-hydrolysing)
MAHRGPDDTGIFQDGPVGFAHRRLTSIFERNKQGSDMPIGEWFSNELASEFAGIVRDVDLGVLDDDAVFDVYNEHTTGRHDYAKFLWGVYVFKHWGLRVCEQGVLDPDE